MMQQWPFGANILVESVSCNFNENIDVGDADFITSTLKDTEMTFKFTELNGTLVEIDTNLQLVGEIERDSKISNVGTFTLRTNKAKNYPPSGEKPYINLCCNDVKVPIAFINFTDSGNKWYFTSESENKNELRIYTSDGDYVSIPSSITVSWNKSSTTKIFLAKQVYSSDEWYIFKAQCLRKLNNGKIVEEILGLYDNSGMPKNNILTIPKLNGKGSNILKYNDQQYNLNFYQYFILGAEVRLRNGDSVYQPETFYYVDSESQGKPIRYYDNTTRPYFVNGIYGLKSERGFPVLNTELSIKWNTSFFFLTEKKADDKNTYYISPSTSKIFWEHAAMGECSPYCDCNEGYTCSHGCNKCESHCPSECDPNKPGCESDCPKYDPKPEYCDLCFSNCEGNSSNICSCNFVCDEFYKGDEDCSTENYDVCYKYAGCRDNNKKFCIMWYMECYNDYSEFQYECVCYGGFCTVDNNSKCYEYYEICQDDYDESREVDCECYWYYEICKQFTTKGTCVNYCDCYQDNWCDDCPGETCTGVTCTSETGPGPTPTPGYVTVPAARQLDGVWGADCTRRVYVTSMGGIWRTKQVFIPAGNYKEVTYHNWPGGFMYGGYFNTYP